MKNIKQASIYLSALLIGALGFLSCSDDDSGSSTVAPATASGGTSLNYAGSYSGTYSYYEVDKTSGNTNDSTVTSGVTVEITGSDPSYLLTAGSDPNSTLTINANGGTFAGSNGQGEFAGSNYSGTFDGSVFVLNGSGEDATSDWIEEYTGVKSGTGGGTGGGGSGGGGGTGGGGPANVNTRYSSGIMSFNYKGTSVNATDPSETSGFANTNPGDNDLGINVAWFGNNYRINIDVEDGVKVGSFPVYSYQFAANNGVPNEGNFSADSLVNGPTNVTITRYDASRLIGTFSITDNSNGFSISGSFDLEQ